MGSCGFPRVPWDSRGNGNGNKNVSHNGNKMRVGINVIGVRVEFVVRILFSFLAQ